MINLEDLERFYNEASYLDLEDTLDAWEIDLEDFGEFVDNISTAGLRDMVRRRNPRMSILTIYLIGFEMGYKVSLEAETRRIANEQG